MANRNPDDKLYYSIGEVSRMTGLEPYVLRYWEKEFSKLSPRKNRGGTRLYTTRDIELINRIKHLRTREKLTIAGTRSKLTLKGKGEAKAELASQAKARTLVSKLRREVEELLEIFS
jgi:DNA-binding transcriptional MerR regulator